MSRATHGPPCQRIDEVHTLVGAGAGGRGGGGGGGLDISNLIKPALARGELQVCASASVRLYQCCWRVACCVCVHACAYVQRVAHLASERAPPHMVSCHASRRVRSASL